MHTSRPKVIRLPRPVRSRAELEGFLRSRDAVVATNRQIPLSRFHELTAPNWTRPAQGLVVMFVDTRDTKRPDPSSPLGRKILPVRSTKRRPNPSLSRFLASGCLPISFEAEGALPAGQTILVIRAKHV